MGEIFFSFTVLVLAISMLAVRFFVSEQSALKEERSKSDKEFEQLQNRFHELEVAYKNRKESRIRQDKFDDLLTHINDIQTELETMLASAETVKANQHKLYELISENEIAAGKIETANDASVVDIESLVHEVVTLRQRVLALREPT